LTSSADDQARVRANPGRSSTDNRKIRILLAQSRLRGPICNLKLIGSNSIPRGPTDSQGARSRCRLSAVIRTLQVANRHGRSRPIADARRLLLRSAFKQPVAELLRHEALRPLPCLVIVTAEREELLEHDALGCCIDGSSPHILHADKLRGRLIANDIHKRSSYAIRQVKAGWASLRPVLPFDAALRSCT
jgi:hypothetical protein